MFSKFLYRPMGWLMYHCSQLFGGNYAVFIFFFTLLINIVFLPLNIKQQKTMAGQARLKNKMAKVQEKYKDDRQKYSEEMSKLYQENNSNPFGGCLLLFIRMPFFVAIYRCVLYPLSYLFGMNADAIWEARKAVGAALGRAEDWDFINNLSQATVYSNIDKVPGYEHFANKISFDFFGIDLTLTPDFQFNLLEIGPIVWIPLLSFATAMLSALVTNFIQKKTNPQAQSAGCMMFMMPFFSLYIAFMVSGAVGFYWACSNFVGMLVSILMQRMYSPGKVIAQLEADQMRERKKYEQQKILRVDAGESSNE